MRIAAIRRVPPREQTILAGSVRAVRRACAVRIDTSMAKKMLIDATHPEETRVVVVDGQRLDEFDFESINKKQLAGNIYLAKVMRVEPSLQACFVDYGGNRHGFLAFSEIHPDYYQIPAAERAALVAAQERASAQANREEDDADKERPAKEQRGRRTRSRTDRGDKPERAERKDRDGDTRRGARRVTRGKTTRSRKRTRDGAYIEREFRIGGGVRVRVVNETDTVDLDLLEREFTIGGSIPVRVLRLPKDLPVEDAEATTDAGTDTETGPSPETMAAASADLDRVTSDDHDARPAPESVGGGDDWDDTPVPRVRLRDYKIQDVIKRRQIMLIQINKEERGNKGAAVTTYLSLAGRYCVLMPNTAKGGGISRKITNAPDRKRLKEIAGNLEVPRGMGLIVRTAGAQQSGAEITRDYEYLLRQWDAIRTLTLESYAPAAIYEEGNLIKRSIRDLYTRDIDAIIVDGNGGYKEAHDYVAMLMPDHTKNVKLHKGQSPLFIEHKVEDQLAAMFNPTVQLKSGGYIVIGVTEALVAVDVNSGRSTRESSIEDTATKTNLEAAEEVARQMRLRDLAGLLVIDFIDMNERRNNAAVERKLKDSLTNDRARIQLGRISSFGLLEMSRQRLRPGMIEATTNPCPHCHGTGLVRSDDTLALTILREIEEEGLRKSTAVVTVEAPVSVANFLHNHKRDRVLSVEQRYGIRVVIEGDPAKISPEFKINTMKMDDAPEHLRPNAAQVPATVSMESVYADTEEDGHDDIEDAVIVADEPAAEQTVARQEPDDRPDRPRRRGRRSERRDGEPKSDARSRSRDPLPVIETDGEADPRGETPFAYGESGGDGNQGEDASGDSNGDSNGRGNSRRSRRGGRKRNKREETPREFGEASALSMLSGRDALDRALPDVFRSDDAIVLRKPRAKPAPKPVAEQAPEATEESDIDTRAEEIVAEARDAVDAASPPATPPVEPPAAPPAAPVPEPQAPPAEEPAVEEPPAREPPVEEPDPAPTSPAIEVEPLAKPVAQPAAKPVAEPTPPEDDRPKRSGWWSR